jgi:hypothetical protein
MQPINSMRRTKAATQPLIKRIEGIPYISPGIMAKISNEVLSTEVLVAVTVVFTLLSTITG